MGTRPFRVHDPRSGPSVWKAPRGSIAEGAATEPPAHVLTIRLAHRRLARLRIDPVRY